MASSSGDVLRALAEQALESGVHADREQVLRDYLGDDNDDQAEPKTEEGQGAGGESKPRDSEDKEPREKSSTTAPESGTQKGRSGK